MTILNDLLKTVPIDDKRWKDYYFLEKHHLVEILPTFPVSIQCPDLTEMHYASQCGYNLRKLRQVVKTQFLFCTTACGPGHTDAKLLDLGYKPISIMNNWYSAHSGERRITFYWFRLREDNPPDIKPRPYGWATNSKFLSPEASTKILYGEDRKYLYAEGRDISASGCGFKLIDNSFEYLWKRSFQYHTLLRLPPRVGPHRLEILKRMRFRLIDIGVQASYWVNGWIPEEYSYKMECDYFKEAASRWKCKIPDYVHPPKPPRQIPPRGVDGRFIRKKDYNFKCK